MTHGSLFSGIGGFDLAAEWMGWENIFHCEWNPFGQKVLKHYWPNAISYEDITKTDFTIHRGKVDIITGGFPCQPYSLAGKRKGKEDERHLWPQMLRTIREVKPSWIVGENVYGLVNWNGGLVFHEVQSDLEAEGYEVFPFLLPACSVNAPHRRDRIWFVAYANLHRCFEERRYDISCKNVDGSKTEKFWSTNTKDFNRFSSYGDIKKQYDIDKRTCIKEIYKEDKTSKSDRVQQLDKKSIEQNGNVKEIKHSNNKGGTLVQNRQNGIQLPINRGLEYDKEILSSSDGFRLQNDICGINRLERDASNSNSTNSKTWTQREILGQQNRKETNEYSNVECSNKWKDFPSVSPICVRDDGFSSKLDGITFPKWRNESIKAGGNAIVPQVAYQIFKTIQEYERIRIAKED